MYGSKIDNVVLWRNFLGFIWDMIKGFKWCIITKFEHKVNGQNHLFGWLRFENWFFIKLLHNDDENCIKNSALK